jgi:hypothetical protein
MLNAERRMLNAERRMLNAERRMPNAERRMPNAERLSLAFRARTVPSQEVPRIDSAAMAIVPMEIDRIFPHWIDLNRTSRFLVHRQGTGFGLRGFPDFASAGFAFFVAGCTWTRIAQPRKGVMALMPILPLNVHALTGALLHLHRLRIGSGDRQNPLLIGLNSSHIVGGAGLDCFVHVTSMTFSAGWWIG